MKNGCKRILCADIYRAKAIGKYVQINYIDSWHIDDDVMVVNLRTLNNILILAKPRKIAR